jgi:hypothetical protein
MSTPDPESVRPALLAAFERRREIARGARAAYARAPRREI